LMENALGRVVYTCPETKLVKYATIRRDGTLHSRLDGFYGSVLEWLDSAPLHEGMMADEELQVSGLLLLFM